jgi:hypothetical protein
MNFERNIEPKEALGIGMKANAVLIETLYFLETERIGDGMAYQIIKSPIAISDHCQVFSYLEKIAAGEMSAYDFCFIPDTGEYPNNAPLTNLSSMSGKYVKYIGRGFLAISAYDNPDEFTNREIIIKIP